MFISPIFCGSGIWEQLSLLFLVRAFHEIVVIWNHSHLKTVQGWRLRLQGGLWLLQQVTLDC